MTAMMLAIFGALMVALILGWIGQRPLALAALAVCFGLSVYLFLWEIWSPETGFRMPWIDTRLDMRPDAADRGRA
jgi:hypothetical protein